MEKGFVYILTNPSFKDNWIKIGKSKNMPNLRAKQLSNTSVPLDYELFATLETEKFNEAEKMIHKQIEMLAPEKRINPKREFFNIKPETASKIFESIKTLLTDGEVKYYGDVIETTKQKRKHGERFDFFKKGLKEGDKINFIDDKSITAVVANNREVVFEDKKFKLSPLVYLIYERQNKLNSSGAYQGPAYWEFKGKKLTEIENK